MFRRVFVAWKNNWTAHGMYMKCNKVVACMNTGNKNCKCTKKWIRMCIVRLGTSNILCFYSKHMFKFKAGNQWSWNNKLRESAVYFVVSSSTRNIIQRMNDKAQMLFYRLHLLYIFWCDFVFFFCCKLFGWALFCQFLLFAIINLSKMIRCRPSALSPSVWVTSLN